MTEATRCVVSRDHPRVDFCPARSVTVVVFVSKPIRIKRELGEFTVSMYSTVL